MRVVILDNLRSAHNVGSIFRTASALQYSEVALCGVTITPPAKKLSDSSRGTDKLISWKSFSATSEAINHYQEIGFHVVALETCPESQPIQDMPKLDKLAWLVGNEAKGICPSLLPGLKHIYYLPMLSEQSGINVSCAFSSAAYHDYFKNT
ncbi:MAG: hypothetical protein HQL32_08805 [Planctomycetes bacterium]|nr:hypothetical protein [Planctomycetota bacterium]